RCSRGPAPRRCEEVEVKKLGNIPDGGGWRFVGRVQGERNRSATSGKPRNRHYNPKIGTAFVHTVLDDHSRVAYAEIHDDETAGSTSASRSAARRYRDGCTSTTITGPTPPSAGSRPSPG